MAESEAEEKKKNFEDAMLQYMEAVKGLALRMTKNRADADDLAQDTWLRAYRFFDKFEEGTNAKAWLFKILKNIFINKYNKKQKAPELVCLNEVEIESSSATPEQIIVENLSGEEGYIAVSAAVKKLPENYGNVIRLFHMKGFSYKEIATELELPLGTVMSLIFKARKRLRKTLHGYAKEHGYIA